MTQSAQSFSRPCSAIDVAAYIVRRVDGGAVTQLKLHKLLYYCQAASLAGSGRVLFRDSIEGWANGPVVPSIWNINRYRGVVTAEGLPSDGQLTSEQAAWVDTILLAYGKLSGAQLSAKTHEEDPWMNSRHGLSSGTFGNRAINTEEMASYYRQKWGWE